MAGFPTIFIDFDGQPGGLQLTCPSRDPFQSNSTDYFYAIECGDGFVHLSEECDPAQTTTGAGCTNSCTRKVPQFSLSVTGGQLNGGPIVSGNKVLVNSRFVFRAT